MLSVKPSNVHYADPDAKPLNWAYLDGMHCKRKIIGHVEELNNVKRKKIKIIIVTRVPIYFQTLQGLWKPGIDFPLVSSRLIRIERIHRMVLALEICDYYCHNCYFLVSICTHLT